MKFQFVKFSIALIFSAAVLLTGCASKAVSYSFTEDEQNSSTIYFQTGNPKLTFISFEGRGPRPNAGTHWDPIIVPSGRELKIAVFAEYEPKAPFRAASPGLLGQIVETATSINDAVRNVKTEVTFECPPLEAGKRYLLSFMKESGFPGKNILILTDLQTSTIVHRQEFQTTFGGFNTR